MLLLCDLKKTVDEIDAVRPTLRSNIQRIEDCHLNKQICDCECCFSNSIQLSSSIVHIDENESEDEYLDAETYTTANSTLDDDLLMPNEQQQINLTNLLDSKNSFNAISSFFNLNNLSSQQANCLNSNVHTNSFDNQFDEQLDNFNNHNSEFNHQQISSSCKSSSSLINTKTATTTNTTTLVTSNSIEQSKCHCKLNSFKVKQRPLSLSSISSSSSSSCSLSRNNSLGTLSYSSFLIL